ncbi:SDR family NAD(P)-dependent oxidoreductase [Novosphingobium colocasiae]|uniref:SDR family NAD(P)-dependent oxidoreductase n=1 Tax=Novosphingobium colocasiae TaxID=1256513 RepID=UPI0035B167BA
MDGLRGKSIVISGGASGIGRATALMLGRAGCRVTIADLNVEAGLALVREIEGASGEAQFVRTDASLEEEREEWLRLPSPVMAGWMGCGPACKRDPVSGVIGV